MAARKVWRIPVLINATGDIVKIWKPRPWTIDPQNDYYETEIAMNAFNEGKVRKSLLTSGLPPMKNIKLVVRKDPGKTKDDIMQTYELLLQMPTLLAKGTDEEFDAFLRKVLPKRV